MITSRHRSLFLLLLILVGGAGFSWSVPPCPVAHLLHLLGERLRIQHDVARWKWQARRPIEDPVRERALLDRLAYQAQQRGLDPRWVRAVFVAQIEAGKVLQRADFTTWSREGPPAGGPELAVLRERLDRVSDQILKALGEAEPGLRLFPHPADLETMLSPGIVGAGITRTIQRQVVRPLVR